MRRLLVVLFAPLALGCPSLDGFVGDGGAESIADVAQNDGGFGGFLSLEDAARFCTKALTCPYLKDSTEVSIEIPVDAANYAACVSWLAGPLPPDRIGLPQATKALSCAASATSCTAADGCMWFEFIDSTDPRCFGITTSACSTDKKSFYECSTGFGAAFIAHCDNPFNYASSACISSGSTFCAVSGGLCSDPDAAAPPPCNGSFYTYCANGLLVGYDCNAQGMTCSAAGCLSNGVLKPCGTVGDITCQGDTVDVCNGQLTSEFNCASMGATCDGSGLVPRCALPQDTCSPYDTNANVCTGDSISLCIGGQPTTFDCASIGMHCASASGKLSAHCE